MRAFLSAIVLIAAITPGAAAAETAYVTDVLQLGLHRAEDTSDRAFESLVSGTALDVLERSARYARVRTPQGEEGWVKAAYLVDEPPARHRLAALEAEIAELRERLRAAGEASARAQRKASRLESRHAAQQETAAALERSVARLERENAAYAARLDDHRLSLPVTWVFGAVGLTLLAGVLAGWLGLDTLMRRRYAGYRLY